MTRGWWNSKGVGGPDRWHVIERKRAGGGHFWTLCERYFTMNQPSTLLPEPPTGAICCVSCEKREKDARTIPLRVPRRRFGPP